jgi:surface polysaccharide O-acyltransferase-like enzyme
MPNIVNAGLDALKIALALMVLAIHCGFLGGNGTLLSYQLNNGLFRIAVPVFFLISGYYLYHSLQRDPHSIKLWLRRAAALYFFWMVLYTPFYVTPATFEDLRGVIAFIKHWVIGFFHLWYVIAMIGGGVMIYLLRNKSNWMLLCLLLLLYCTGALLQYMRAYYEIPFPWLQHINKNDYVGRNFLFVAFPLMTLGFLIARNRLQEKITTRQVLTLLLFGCALVLAEATLHYQLQQDSLRTLNFDCMLSVLIAAPALFLLPLRHVIEGRSVMPAKLSAAIYFLHPLVLILLLGFGFEESTLTTLVVLALSLLASVLLIRCSRRLRFVL